MSSEGLYNHIARHHPDPRNSISSLLLKCRERKKSYNILHEKKNDAGKSFGLSQNRKTKRVWPSGGVDKRNLIEMQTGHQNRLPAFLRSSWQCGR